MQRVTPCCPPRVLPSGSWPWSWRSGQSRREWRYGAGWSFGQTLAASGRARSLTGLCPKIMLGEGESALYPSWSRAGQEPLGNGQPPRSTQAGPDLPLSFLCQKLLRAVRLTPGRVTAETRFGGSFLPPRLACSPWTGG